MLSQEVRDKQILVMALENQKSNLTNELKSKIEEIKMHRMIILRKLEINKDNTLQVDTENGAQMSLQNKQKMVGMSSTNSSNNSTPRTLKMRS